jgi:hypothetical protein
VQLLQENVTAFALALRWNSHGDDRCQIQRLPQEDLDRIWRAIRKDKDGARALAILKKHGFDLETIPVESYTWPGIIASFPFFRIGAREVGSFRGLTVFGLLLDSCVSWRNLWRAPIGVLRLAKPAPESST